MSKKQDDWIGAGFFLLSEGKSSEKSPRLLPAHIITVSNCIVDTYPDSWALPWVDTPADELRSMRDSLGLDDNAFGDLRSWVEQAMESGDFGWPNVFFSVRAGREFSHRFLGALQGVRLVGLSLTKDVAADFLREEAPQEGRGASGVWTMLARRELLAQPATQLGFDVLGAEYGGWFHTFSCNGLEKDFSDKLGVLFNQCGLIDEYVRAVAASEYTNRDDTGAEPVAWYPFRVDDYGAKETG